MDTFCWYPTRSRIVFSVSWFLCWVLQQELIMICWQWRRGNVPESFFPHPCKWCCQKVMCYMFNLDFSKVGSFGGKTLKLKNQRKKPKQKHLCLHHCFSPLLLVICSNWCDFAFCSWSVYSQSCLIKNTSIPLTRTFGACLSFGKDNPGMAPPQFPWDHPHTAVGSASHWSRGSFVSFLPQLHVPRAWRWLSTKVSTPSHPREAHTGFPDKYHQGWRKSSMFSPLPGELIQNKNVTCFTAGGRSN